MKRRHAVALVGGSTLGSALSVLAQPAAKLNRIGMLSQVFARSELIMKYLERRLLELEADEVFE